MSDELNVWREASDAASGNAVKWKPAAEERAAAVIRTYGDERHAVGYQAAIADVVEWLREGGRVDAAEVFTRRFGKGQ